MSAKTVEATDDFGFVSITMTGHQQVTAAQLRGWLADELTEEDAARYEQAISTAVNRTIAASKETATQRAMTSFDDTLAALDVPEHLRQDRYWRSILYIFTQQPYLKGLIPEYFNFQTLEIDCPGLRKLNISYGLNFLVKLALHLYNGGHPLPPDGLTGLAHLDDFNYRLAIRAIDIRFK